MPKTYAVRPLTDEEYSKLNELAHSRTALYGMLCAPASSGCGHKVSAPARWRANWASVPTA